MGIDFSLTKKGWMVVSIMLAVELVFFAVLATLLHDTESYMQEEHHYRAIKDHLDRMKSEAHLAGVGLIRIVSVRETTDSTVYHSEFMSHIPGIYREIRILKRLLVGKPKELAPIEALEKDLNETEEVLQRVTNRFEPTSMKRNMNWATVDERFRLLEFANHINNEADLIIRSYKDKVRVSEDALVHQKDVVKFFLVAGVLTNIVLAVCLVQFFHYGIARRINLIADNSYRLASDMPLNPVQEGGDEIAVLDEVFHKVAEALHDASQREQAFIRNARDVICSIDIEERFVSINPAALAVWGYTPEDLIGKRYTDIIENQDKEKNRAVLMDIMDGAKETPVENKVHCKGGHTVDMLWSCRYSQKESLLFCVAYDISERKQAERERQEIARMKQDFMAMVSHDLRTPLTSIKATLTLFIEGVYDANSEVGKKRLKGTMDSAERLISLVNDLLDLQKLDAGEMVLEKEECKLANVGEHALDSVVDFAGEKQVKIESDMDDATVYGDQDRLEQVFINLLSNAIKFSPPGSAVHLSVSGNGDFVEARVRDRGCGISSEQQALIFERFKQATQQNGKIAKGGTGLGLAICKSIVEAHDGTIGVSSEPEKGSTFWFRLPTMAKSGTPKHTACADTPGDS